MRLQTPSAPIVLSLTPLLRTLQSVQCLAVIIWLCVCTALARPHRRQPYLANFSKYFLAAIIMYGFGDTIWGEYLGGKVSGCASLQSLCYTTHFSYKFSPMYILFPFSEEPNQPHIILPSWASCDLWILSWVFRAFWANSHLSVRAYHVCSFVTRWTHSGWHSSSIHLLKNFINSTFLISE